LCGIPLAKTCSHYLYGVALPIAHGLRFPLNVVMHAIVIVIGPPGAGDRVSCPMIAVRLFLGSGYAPSGMAYMAIVKAELERRYE
jgi:hypothetical protein